MSTQCQKHEDYEVLFLNVKETQQGQSRLLCELCVQDQIDSSALNLLSIASLKQNNNNNNKNGFNKFQKLLQFVDEENILIPYINFDIVQNGTLEQINQFYDEISTSLLSFIENKRNSAQKCYYGLVEAQSKLENYSRLEELKSIFSKQNEVDQQIFNQQIQEFFVSQSKQKNQIQEYLNTCVGYTNQLQSFQNIKNKIPEIKQNIENMIKLEDGLTELQQISETETNKVNQLRNQIQSLTKQIQKVISSKTSLQFSQCQPFSQNISSSQQPIQNSIDLYQYDLINKSKEPNYLMVKIANAIRNNKTFLPLQITQTEEEKNNLIFTREQSGDILLGIIDVPLNNDVYGKSFKVKVLKGFVFIGICARDVNVKRNYRVDTQIYSPSSGYVLFASGGYTYSSFNPSQNNVYLKCHYYADSIVTITPCDNKLTFHCDSFKKTDYYFEPADDVVYTPCFVLSQDSQIQFLEE